MEMEYYSAIKLEKFASRDNKNERQEAVIIENTEKAIEKYIK